MSDDARRKGRPPLDPRSPSVGVCLKLPGRVYDALDQRANAQGVSVPELLRRQLRRAQAADPDDDD